MESVAGLDVTPAFRLELGADDLAETTLAGPEFDERVPQFFFPEIGPINGRRIEFSVGRLP